MIARRIRIEAVFLAILLAVSSVSALGQFGYRYNPFTGKQDIIIQYNTSDFLSSNTTFFDSTGGWTNTSTSTSTDLNVNVTTGNLTIPTGYLGVGTSVPSALVTIRTSTSNDPLSILADGNVNNGVVTIQRSDVNNGNYAPRLVFKRSSGSVGTPAAVSPNDQIIGVIDAYGHEGVGWRQAADIEFRVNGSVSAYNVPGKILFKTTNDTNVDAVERMRIESDGSVHISGTESATNQLVIHSGTIQDDYAMEFIGNDGKNVLGLGKLAGNQSPELLVVNPAGDLIQGEFVKFRGYLSSVVALEQTENASLNSGMDSPALRFKGNYNNGGTIYDLQQDIIFSPVGQAAYKFKIGSYGGNYALTIFRNENRVPRVGINQESPQAQLHVNPNFAGQKGLIVQAYTDQTANLQEWQNGSGSALAYVTASGYQYAPVFRSIGNSYSLDGSGLQGVSSFPILWSSSSSNYASAPDTGLMRESAGIVSVTNGSTGMGSLNASQIYVNGTVVCTASNGLCGSASSGSGWTNDSLTTSTDLNVNVIGDIYASTNTTAVYPYQLIANSSGVGYASRYGNSGYLRVLGINPGSNIDFGEFRLGAYDAIIRTNLNNVMRFTSAIEYYYDTTSSEYTGGIPADNTRRWAIGQEQQYFSPGKTYANAIGLVSGDGSSTASDSFMGSTSNGQAVIGIPTGTSTLWEPAIVVDYDVKNVGIGSHLTPYTKLDVQGDFLVADRSNLGTELLTEADFSGNSSWNITVTLGNIEISDGTLQIGYNPVENTQGVISQEVTVEGDAYYLVSLTGKLGYGSLALSLGDETNPNTFTYAETTETFTPQIRYAVFHPESSGIVNLSIILNGSLFGHTMNFTDISLKKITGGNADIAGNLTVHGNITGNILYADMNAYNDAGFTVPQTTQNVYENVTNMSASHMNGFTFADNTTLIPGKTGDYKIDYSLSFNGLTGKTHGIGIGINGIIDHECYSRRKLGADDVGNVAGTCIKSLSQGDEITLMIDPEDAATNDVTVISASVAIFRVGGMT